MNPLTPQRRSVLARQVVRVAHIIDKADFLARRDAAIAAIKTSMLRFLKPTGLDFSTSKTKHALADGLEVAVEHLIDHVKPGMSRQELKNHIKESLLSGSAFIFTRMNDPHHGDGASFLEKHKLGDTLEIEAIRATQKMLSPRRKVITWKQP